MKKAIRVASVVLQVVVLLLAVVMLLPKLLGWGQYAVLTGSMRPTLAVGSMIIVQPVKLEALAVGDIITYTTVSGGDVVTHRVVALGQDGATTRGDANNSDDPNPVTDSRLLGKVALHIPFLGYLSLFIQRAGPVTIILLLAALYILVGVIPQLIIKRDEPEKPTDSADEAA